MTKDESIRLVKQARQNITDARATINTVAEGRVSVADSTELLETRKHLLNSARTTNRLLNRLDPEGDTDSQGNYTGDYGDGDYGNPPASDQGDGDYGKDGEYGDPGSSPSPEGAYKG